MATEENITRLRAELLAVLFRAGERVDEEKLCEFFEVGKEELSRVVVWLKERVNPLGLEILRAGGGYRLVTHPDAFHTLQSFFSEIKETMLSHQALEVLAIIAYKQPVTRCEIEEIRKKDCSSVIHSLLAKRLIRVKGRDRGPGRPYLYVTTPLFLETFGLSSLEELPKMDLTKFEEKMRTTE